MKNCIVAQSGGPTSVINSSVVGVVRGNREAKCYDKVYGGINGIEGILNNKIIDLTELDDRDLETLKYTPAAGLGSCRYKMKDFTINEEEYLKLFEILDRLDIQTFFYIGGNDSMDTVNKLSLYAKEKGIDKQIIGIPKTIDNDLFSTDHTPGYGSAAKFIATTALETYLDASVYTNNGIFIMETMGRDTGWLAASGALAKLNGESVVDFIYLPEVPFSNEKFLQDVEKRFNENNKVFIVASEGLKDERGSYIFDTKSSNKHDTFSHVQLGGVGSYLKGLLINKGITNRVKVLELGVAQRCAMHCISETDVEEAYEVGKAALKYSIEGDSGFMVGIERVQNKPYQMKTCKVEASKVANNIKYFPAEWINDEKNNITREGIEYIAPLVMGSPKPILDNGLPKYIKLY
jgi:6-phosphofructokinase 1